MRPDEPQDRVDQVQYAGPLRVEAAHTLCTGRPRPVPDTADMTPLSRRALVGASASRPTTTRRGARTVRVGPHGHGSLNCRVLEGRYDVTVTSDAGTRFVQRYAGTVHAG